MIYNSDVRTARRSIERRDGRAVIVVLPPVGHGKTWGVNALTPRDIPRSAPTTRGRQWGSKWS